MNAMDGAAGIGGTSLAPAEDYLVETSDRDIARDDGDEPRIVRSFKVSTSRDLVLTQAPSKRPERVLNVPREGDLDVYGDVVRIVGSITKPGGKFRIFCRRLEFVSPDGRTCVIDVSGEPGTRHGDRAVVEKPLALNKPPRAGAGKDGQGRTVASAKEYAGDDGEAGGDGGDGGTIVIRAAVLEAQVNVELTANGGDGGSGGHGAKGCHGQDGGHASDSHVNGCRGGDAGHGGHGGNGGGGGKGGIVYFHVLSCGARKVVVLALGGVGGNGGKGGDGGDGGDGGKAKTITRNWAGPTFGNGNNGGKAGSGGDAGGGGNGGHGGGSGTVAHRRHPAGSLEVLNGGARGGEPGLAGSPGKPGTPGKRSRAHNAKRGFAVIFNSGYHDGKDGAGGSHGSAANDGTTGGNADQAGTIEPLPGETGVAALAGPPASGFADACQSRADILAQLRMLLEHAGLVHLMSDVSKGSPSLLEIYAWIADWAGACEQVGETQALRDEAAALARLAETGLARVRAKLDYFGKSYRHAALHSVKALRETLETSLSLYEKIDAAARDMARQLTDAAEAAGDRKAFEAAYQAESDAIDEAIKEIKQHINDKVEAIKVAEGRRAARAVALLRAIATFRGEFSRMFFDIEPERIVMAMGQLAFAETPGMNFLLGSAAAGEVATDMRQWARKGLMSDAGVFYDEALLTSKVDRVGRDLDEISLKDGFRKGLDSFIDVSDPDGYRLLATQRDLDELCEQFYATSEEARQTEQAMDSFVAAVQARNAEIAAYNFAVSKVAELTSRSRHTATELARIRESLAKGAKPNLPCVAAGVARRRRRSLETLVEELYNAGRAVMFWRLKRMDAFAGSESEISFASIRMDKLQASMISLLKEIGDTEDVPRKYAPPWESDWIACKATGVLVYFDREDETFFDDLLGGHEVTIRVPHPSSDKPDRLEPFRDMPACRVLELRAWLDSDRPLNEPVYFEIIHTGSEDILDRRGRIFSMQHDPVSDIFAYDGRFLPPSPGKRYKGSITKHWGPWRKESANWDRIVPIGPFTQWRLVLRPEYNESLLEALRAEDGPRITGLTLEFRCLYATRDLSPAS